MLKLQKIFRYKNHDDGKSRIVYFFGKEFKYRRGWWINYHLLGRLCFYIFPTKNSRTEFKKFCDKINEEMVFLNTLDKLSKYQKKILSNLKKKDKIKVFFLVNENSKWQGQSLYDLMAKTQKFEPIICVTAIANKSHETAMIKEELEYNYNFFKNKGMNVIYAYKDGLFLDLKKLGADIIFYEQYWYLSKEQDALKTCKDILLCYFGYGTPNYADKELDCKKDFYKLLYRYYVINEEYAKIYRNWSGLTNIVASGHPKLDIMAKHAKESKENYTIYAPHYSISSKNNPVNYSTFLEYGNLILEFAKNHPEIKWAFKPHPLLKKTLIECFGEDMAFNYYYKWEKIAKCCYDSSYIELFFDSKALITDCASFLTEYFCTKKPIIHLIQPKQKVKVAKPFKKILNTFYKVNNNIELENTLKQVVLDDKDFKKDERLKVLEKSKLLSSNAAENIVKDLENSIWRNIKKEIK